jgi:hypothetical protein
MIPKQAIERAIEGGWGAIGWRLWQHEQFEVIALDPTFWQSLGKALEWSEEHFTSCAIWKTGECDCSAKDEWKEKAKEFYDLILERKGTTAFWEEILK